MQVLNELVGPGNVKFSMQSPNPGLMAMPGPKLLSAEVTVEGQTFSGSGPSKSIAKNIAAEAAIHYVVMQRSKEQPPEDGARFQDTTPWGALASLGRSVCVIVVLFLIMFLALFKLFNDWQSSGYSLPSELCSKEMDMKGGMRGLGPVGSMGGAERMLSGLGVGPDMGQSGQAGQGFDFTDESGTFHTFSPEADVFNYCKQVGNTLTY